MSGRGTGASGRCGIIPGYPIRIPGLARIVDDAGNWLGAPAQPPSPEGRASEAAGSEMGELPGLVDADGDEFFDADGDEPLPAAAPDFEMRFTALHTNPAQWLDAMLLAHRQATPLLQFSHTPAQWQHLRDGGVDIDNVALNVQQQADGDMQFEHGEALLLMPAYSFGEPCLFGTEAAQAIEQERRHCAAAGRVAPARVQAGRLSPFSFVSVRAVAFSDGIALCGRCSNPGCDRSAADAKLFDGELDRPEKPDRSYAAVFGERPPLCRCALAALKLTAGGPLRQGDHVISFPSFLDAIEECPVWRWYYELEDCGAPLRDLSRPKYCCRRSSQAIAVTHCDCCNPRQNATCANDSADLPLCTIARCHLTARCNEKLCCVTCSAAARDQAGGCQLSGGACKAVCTVRLGRRPQSV